MELRHLRYFVAVAEEENVTRAAARLHVSQPSLSRQVRDMEDALGVALFEHGPRSVRLTPAGRYFLEEARRILTQVDAAVRGVQEFASGQEGELHLGYAPSLTTQILPDVLRRYREQCPKVRVRLHDLSTEAMLRGVREGSLQAALVVQPSGPAMDGLRYREIRAFQLAVAMAPEHRWQGAEAVGLEELAQEPLVIYSPKEYPEYYAMVTRVLRPTKAGPKIAAQYDSSTSLIAAVQAGEGVALVQDGFEALAGERLVIRPLASAQASFSFGLCWHGEDRSAFTRGLVAAAFGGDGLRLER